MKHILFYLTLTLVFQVLRAEEVSNRILGFYCRGGYVMYVCDEYKFIWFNVPKVCSSTIIEILYDNVRNPTVKNIGLPWSHPNYYGYTKFAFVRNPWDRVVSCYFDKVVHNRKEQFAECFDRDFNYFVEYIGRQDLTNCDPHIKLQSSQIPHEGLDYIGRYENFSEDFLTILETIGINIEKVHHYNCSVHQHYSEYYTEKTKNIIAQKYKQDIELFGYDYEE